MWAHEHDVEPAALQQLRNIAALPWVHGVRVMPDVHLGKGATVGSVIAMRDAVSPNALGAVDEQCCVCSRPPAGRAPRQSVASRTWSPMCVVSSRTASGTSV